jgi:hypothetical protein
MNVAPNVAHTKEIEKRPERCDRHQYQRQSEGPAGPLLEGW